MIQTSQLLVRFVKFLNSFPFLHFPCKEKCILIFLWINFCICRYSGYVNCRMQVFALPLAPYFTHRNGSKSNVFRPVRAVAMAIAEAVISLPMVLRAPAAATSDGRVRRRNRKLLKTIHLLLFYFGPSAHVFHYHQAPPALCHIARRSFWAPLAAAVSAV